MDDWEIVWLTFAIFGALKILYVILPWVYWKLFCCIDLKKYSSGYVCITGATDGIGKALTKEFARRGFKILMVSRNQSKLESVKREIEALYANSEIQYIQADFSMSHKNAEEFFTNLNEKLKNYEISILVNNVGVSDSKDLLNEDDGIIENQIGVNIYPATMLTYYLLPEFIKKHEVEKKKSLIINFSSTAELLYSPNSAVYSATKKYNHFFSEAIAFEYKDCVEVATIKPGIVITDLSATMKLHTYPLKVKPDDYAKSMVGSLRTGISYGHWKHFIFGNFLSFMPFPIQSFIIQRLMPL